MKTKHWQWTVLFFYIAVAAAEQPIKSWRNEQGIWHFSNIDTDAGAAKQAPLHIAKASPTLPASAPPQRLSPVLTALMQRALEQLRNNELEHAFFSLERALRIAGDNSLVWHYMARVRWQQGDYEQTEILAQRSNRSPGANTVLKQYNNSLIAMAQAYLAGNRRLSANGRAGQAGSS